VDEVSTVVLTHAFPETTSHGCYAETDGYEVESVYSYSNDVCIALNASICQDVAKLCGEKGVSHFTVCLSGNGQSSKDVATDMSLVVVKIIPRSENATAKSPSSTISENGDGSNFDPSLGDESEHQDILPSSAGGEHHRLFISEISSNGFSSSKKLLNQATTLSVEMPAQCEELLTRCPCGRDGGLHIPSRLNAPRREEGEDNISQCDDSENMQSTLDVWLAHNRLKAIAALPQIHYGDIESNRNGPPLEDDVSHADAQRLISFSDPVRNVALQELEGQMFPSNHGEIRARRLLATAPPETAPSRLSTPNLDMTDSSFEMNLVGNTKNSALTRVIVLCALCSVAVAVVVVTTVTQRNTSAVAPGNSLQKNTGEAAKRSPDQSTLDFIRIRGSLVCGVVENPGFSIFNDTSGEWSGFEVDLVRFNGVKQG
jgi:hypothetical protein